MSEAAVKRGTDESRAAARTAAALEGLQRRVKRMGAAEQEATELRKRNCELQQRIDDAHHEHVLVKSELDELVRCQELDQEFSADTLK